MTEPKRSYFEGACAEFVERLKIFVNEGEATDELLAHIDSCPACGAAVDRAFEAQAAQLQRFAAELRVSSPATARNGRGFERGLRVALIAWAILSLLLMLWMLSEAFCEKRAHDIGRATRSRVAALFPGAMVSCSPDYGTLCYLGKDEEACRLARSVGAVLPGLGSADKVFCEFRSWPAPDPNCGASFLIVRGTEVVGYRGPRCRSAGSADFSVSFDARGTPTVRRAGDDGDDECGLGPRLEVGRWQLPPAR